MGRSGEVEGTKGSWQCTRDIKKAFERVSGRKSSGGPLRTSQGVRILPSEHSEAPGGV